jgi:hypothetical protein
MSDEKQIPPPPVGNWIQLVWSVADRYGPAGILVVSLMVGMWYTTGWLRDESQRNDQSQQALIAKFTATIGEQRDHFDKILEREHKEFRSSLTEITKTFNDVMNSRRSNTGPGQ